MFFKKSATGSGTPNSQELSAPQLSFGFRAPLAADPTTQALAWRGLGKSFSSGSQSKWAVNGVDLDVPAGSFYGFVGPNGAGKTTALTMATGLLRPTTGKAWVNGHPVWESEEHTLAAKHSFGLLADGVPTFDRLTGPEYLSYVGQLRGMDPAEVSARSKELLEVLELSDTGKKLISDFSAGMTKKILLAGALIHRPALLVLDEPFEAVDPVSAHRIQQLLRSYVAAGGTVLLSSHVMELVANLCSHVAVLAAGQLLAAGTLAEVSEGRDLGTRFNELVGARDLDSGALAWLKESEDEH